MSNPGKRTFIDLTGDDENDVPQRKQPRLQNQNRSQNPSLGQSLWSSQNLTARDQWSVMDDGAENEVIDLSQDAEEGYGWLSIGTVNTKIVGIRYYNGYATPGEQVMVRREPGNPYDSNAIRVNNVQGTQIGHIPRQMASKLASYMDRKAIVIEATLAGEKGGYECPLRLRIFAPCDATLSAELEAKLKRDGVPLQKPKAAAAPKKPTARVETPSRKPMGFSSSQPGSSQQAPPPPELDLAHFIANSEQFKPRDVEKLAEELGLPEDILAKMPMADQPENLKSTLLPYQRQGLAWMMEKENPVLPAVGSKQSVQLWKRFERDSNKFQNIATNYCDAAPVLAKGGILADDMGLGKTLQVISLILEGGSGTTLIVAPVSVMSNWAQQMERHIKEENALKVFTYHGNSKIVKGKKMDSKLLSQYDVVITTYGTLASELYPRGSKEPGKIPSKDGLFSMNWHRIVLDEGHQIRNPSTKYAMATSSIKAKSRWVLTGTPIVNTIKDFYSMLKFLGVSGGLQQLELFNANFTRPLATGDPNAEILLQTAMRAFCLRRKKDMKFVDLKLPELKEYVHRIKFRSDELEKYDALREQGQGIAAQIDRQAESRKKNTNAYTHALEILLRLRQICNHWKLCESRVNALMESIEKDEVVILNKETKLALQMLLQLSIDSHEECSICLEELHSPVITTCKHVFGQQCIERTIELQHKCPMCRAPLANADCLVHPAVEKSQEEDENINTDEQSSKTAALMEILKVTHQDPLSKVVVFSQWTSFLNIVQKQLDTAGYTYSRIDGSMKPEQRDKSMQALEQNPKCRILLASLAVCSVGLNLVAADTVILCDSWWAPAIEDQAVDRVHRLGQKRETKVWRLVMEDSVEERVLEIQAEKRKLVGTAFREGVKGGKGKETRMGDILKLLR